MFNIGPLELMVILVIALLVVGPKRLPEVGRSIGRGLREFRRAQDEVTRTIRMGIDDEPGGEPGGAEGTSPATAPGTVATDVPAAAPEPDAATDAVRTLGRSLAELRRAREELQRSFRVDLTTPAPRPHRARPTAAAPTPPGPAAAEPPERPSASPPVEPD